MSVPVIEKNSNITTDKPNSTKVFKLGELFCGPGGIALGAARAKLMHNGVKYSFEHAWANDIDKDTCDTYAANICPEHPEKIICEDIRKLDISSLSPIDAFAYGFPCNDFSIVGEQKGFDGTYGPLYTHGINILDKFKPKFVIAENVGGMTSANEGKAFIKILNDLEKAGNGYEITAHLYKFQEYGVPQTRHRIIIVGIDKSYGLTFKVPAPIVSKPKTIRDILIDNPIPKWALNNEYTTQSKTVAERLSYIKPGENAWTANLPERLKLKVKGAKLSQIYRRLDPDKPSYTITGSGGGGTHGYHWEENRALTNRERARIQTFPDNYEFKGSKESIRKQIGMAVSPLMAQIIFEAVLNTFAGKEYESVPANVKV